MTQSARALHSEAVAPAAINHSDEYQRYLSELIRSPNNREVQAVFADWLLERGDSRGEALALELSGARSVLRLLQKKHARAWLSSELCELVDLDECGFYGPFLTRLSARRNAQIAWSQVPPTVRHVTADLAALAVAVEPLLKKRHPFDTLEARFKGARSWTWNSDEIESQFAQLVAFPSRELMLTPVLFCSADEVVGLSEMLAGLNPTRHQLTLHLKEGPLDAALHWLLNAGLFTEVDLTSVLWGGAKVAVTRDRLGQLSKIVVDVTFDDPREVAARLASACTLVSQLKPLRPSQVEVVLGEGQRLPRLLRQSAKMAALRAGGGGCPLVIRTDTL